MLRVVPQRQSCLLEAMLPDGVQLLNAELRAIDGLLGDGEVYASVWRLWRERDAAEGTLKLVIGRKTIPSSAWYG